MFKMAAVSAALWALIVCCIIALPGLATAQDDPVTTANQATLTAFNAGDFEQAAILAQEAVRVGRALPNPDPIAFAFALNNLGYALMNDAETEPRALALFDEVLRTKRATQPWLYALQNKAQLTLNRGQNEQVLALANDLISAGRNTPWHALAAGAASDLFFQINAYGEMVAALTEMVAVDGPIYSATTMETMDQAKIDAEQAGQIDAVSFLIDARIILAKALRPDQARDIAHRELWTKFFLNYLAENYGVAADALRVWATTGDLSVEEQDFIDGEATGMLLLTQGTAFTQGRSLQLGQAQLALAYAELLPDPDDIRRGLALRELAAAQTQLGYYQEAATTLQRAIAVLERTQTGRAELHLVLADLATNAWLRGENDLAAALGARSDKMYQAAVAAGSTPLPPLDLSITANNRALIALDRGQLAQAETLIATAWTKFEADQAFGVQKTNQMAHEINLHGTQALIYLALNQENDAIASAKNAAEISRTILPSNHPARALALSNAADLLFVLAEVDRANDYLVEAAAIYVNTLPYDAPLAVETKLKVALNALTTGDRMAAIKILREVTQARKSPAYRTSLPSVSGNFEMLAWALLDGDTPPDATTLNEAFEALQWTQISRSATALAMMETRIAAANPGQAALLRRRQDVTEALTRNRSALTMAYARDTVAPQSASLHRQYDTLSRTLTQLEADLGALGLDETGIATVSTLGISEVQALLAPDEALVTFLLPSLKPGAIDGLTQSSNFTIAITHDSVQIARVPEISRGHLNDRITDFRCQIAVSDPDCNLRGSAALRGAMLEGDPEDDTGFDQHAAQALYADLFGGVEDVLKGKTHLIIAPPGDQLRLPFQALVTRVNPSDDLAQIDWLVRRHAISVIPSIPSLRTLRGSDPQQEHRPLGRLLGVGDPSIGTAASINCDTLTLAALRAVPSGFPTMIAAKTVGTIPLADPARLAALPRLPDASCEISAIAQAFDPAETSVLLQDAATETAIKALHQSGELEDFDVLVFATHGLISGQSGAAAPGLVLTPPTQATELDDGLLTAAEIATLTLNARLVVLSACNTAAGDSAAEEGLSGLARAFFHAGAQSLMVTHWSVYSEAAVEVSTGLFGTLQTDPELGHAQALRQTVLGIIDQSDATGFQAHPSYWAAFAMIGVD